MPVAGVRIAAVKAGIRYPDRLDLVLVELSPGSEVAAVFTRNLFCAAPVQVARRHLQDSPCRYLLINTGNANAGTGEVGVNDALACCEAVARQIPESGRIPVQTEQILPFSTGVIGERLPVQRIVKAVPAAIADLGENHWEAAANGILTTDTRPKIASTMVSFRSKGAATVTGIAKGAGMIRPDMATMLAFVFTDAKVEKPLLHELLNRVVNRSFNRITVDGDTSTNDSCVLVATGESGCVVAEDDRQALDALTDGLQSVFRQLATELIRDAEGASKFISINVINGSTTDECLAVAYAIAESPLVKTAFFASDPNWGRILAAVGRAGLRDLNIDRVSITLGDTPLVENGSVAESYTETDGQAEMDKDEITVVVDLARGDCRETVWTSDLSHDYIRINAEYRT